MRLLAGLFLIATPAVSQGVPAPEYFVATAMQTSTAQILAVNCATLSIDPGAMALLTDRTLRQLSEDGFSPETLAEQMEDPSEAIAVLQDAFVARHDLAEDVDEAKICAAGRSEISEATPIGALLLEVEG
ncbi:DUF5333 family protein [Jannaschia sp. 2305UL9-9]|uniref:DUF5333 family protein n=1 Tax=Jannaschia sp. 2305UL9-9 TaxID=3121638 RepID=UPI003528E8BA